MELATIINHPTLRDGITDGLATLVVAAATLRDAHEIERMLNPGYADIETLSKGTALTPNLKISIVRTGTPRQPDTASGLWSGLEFSERMLQTPLPVSHAIFVMNHNAVPEGHGGGNHKGFAIAYNPGFEQGGHQARRQLHFVHETSHYYWIHGENWISEGMAETAAWMYAAESGAGPGLWKLPRYDCEAQDLEMLMEWNPQGYRAEQRICYYYLGQQLFLELQENLEPGEFSEKLRELYLLTRDREASGETSGIDEVRQVFPSNPQPSKSIVWQSECAGKPFLRRVQVQQIYPRPDPVGSIPNLRRPTRNPPRHAAARRCSRQWNPHRSRGRILELPAEV